MKRLGASPLPLIAVLFLLAGSLAHSDSVPGFVILHSNDVLGELEPCGCRNNPLGGMQRKERLLKEHEQLALYPESSRLQVDSGDLFFSGTEIAPTLRAQTEIQARALAQALKSTGLQVMVPGEKDFALGVSFYKKLIQLSQVTAVAANLEWRNSSKAPWKPMFAPHTIVTLKSGSKKLRAAVFGLVGTSISWPENIRATDPTRAAKKLVPLLKKKSDLIIALTHQGLEEDLRLARNVPGIDRIIGAHSQSFLQDEILEGQTRIHQSSFRNQHLGFIPIAFDKSQTQKSQLIELGALFDTEDTETTPVREIIQKTKKQISEANLSAQKSIGGNSSAHSKLQTFTQCSECHARQFEFWRKTPHAQAFEVLAKTGAENNKECIGCHSVGFGQKNGFSEVKDLVEWSEGDKTHHLASFLKELRDIKSPERAAEHLRKAKRIHATVQCENCHVTQPNSAQDHPFGLSSQFPSVQQETCLQCHTPARAPGWYQAEKGGNGTLDTARLKAKFIEMSCPRGDAQP